MQRLSLVVREFARARNEVILFLINQLLTRLRRHEIRSHQLLVSACVGLCRPVH